jgi:aryl-alcohol dehydrogenase-like predicted oxidoreductase
VSQIAADKGVTPGQIALAWVRAQGDDIVPIPGTTRQDHLNENAAALGIRLAKKDLVEIEAAMPKGSVSGLRYPETMMKRLNL